MKSKLATDVLNTIKKVFPHEVVIEENYVYYKGTRLFFDFYLKGLGVLVECQGEQHYGFVKHFHGNIDNFKAHQRRDRLKVEYVEENSLTLVYFVDKKDKITDDLVLKRIYEAQCG